MENLMESVESMVSDLSEAIKSQMVVWKSAYDNEDISFSAILDNAIEDSIGFDPIDEPEKMYEALMMADPEGIKIAKAELAEKGSEGDKSIVVEQYIESSAIDRYFEKYD